MSAPEPPWVSWLGRAAWLLMVAAGLLGFLLAFPAWLEELDAGHPGCTLELQDGHWVVSGASWADAPCERAGLIGSTVRAVDGTPVTGSPAPEVLQSLTTRQPSTVHAWTVVDLDGGSRTVEVAYEQGPLAHFLESTGDTRADVIVAGVAGLGALARTAVFTIAAFLLTRVGGGSAVPMLLSGALFSFAYGLGFDSRHAPPIYARVWELNLLFVVVGLATILATLPGRRLRGPGTLLFGVLWVVGTAVALVLRPAGLDEWGVAAQLGMASIAVGMLARRYLRSASPAEKHQLSWVLIGLGVATVSSLPDALPILPAAATEFHLDLVHPLTFTVLPLALLAAIYENQAYDLPNIVRNTTLVGVYLGTAALASLLFAELVPMALHLLHADPAQAFPPWVEPAAVLFSGVLVTLLGARWLAAFTDVAIFPNRVTAPMAIRQTTEALSDCWNLDEIDWCIRRAMRLGFDVPSAFVCRWDGQAWRRIDDDQPWDPGLLPAQQAALLGGSAVDLVADDDSICVLVPALSHGQIQGCVVAPSPAAYVYTPSDRARLVQLGPATGDALWRATRPMTLGREARRRRA